MTQIDPRTKDYVWFSDCTSGTTTSLAYHLNVFETRARIYPDAHIVLMIPAGVYDAKNVADKEVCDWFSHHDGIDIDYVSISFDRVVENGPIVTLTVQYAIDTIKVENDGSHIGYHHETRGYANVTVDYNTMTVNNVELLVMTDDDMVPIETVTAMMTRDRR